MPANTNPSTRFRKAARAERDRLLHQRGKAETAASHIREQLQAAEDRVHQLDEQISALHGLVGEAQEPAVRLAPEESSGDGRKTLRGSSIRETAVRVLLESERAGDPIHYRAWLDLLGAAGYEIVGKRPDAVFLNQVVRSPAVKATTKAGVYELDWDAPERLQRQVAQLQLDLRNATAHGALDAEDLEKLTLEIRRAQRAHQEAVAAFGSKGELPEKAAA
jgi:hypothetical protein